MKSLSMLLRSLESSHYVTGRTGSKEATMFFDIMKNGKLYCDYLKQQWQLTRTDGLQTHYIESESNSVEATRSENRLEFIQSEQFLANIRDLRLRSTTQCPAIVKAEYRTLAPIAIAKNSLLHFAPESRTCATRLISDYFFHSACGLAKFYNIQRERKIWWMRFSANPSRYYLEPFALGDEKQGNLNLGNHCQSVTIKSRFKFGAAAMEHITLVPLRLAAAQGNSVDFELTEASSGERVLPAVIRSVIDLEMAASAMLLDGCDHNREKTLLLNRKLAPFQCAVGCLHKNKSLEDLRDLRDHLMFILRRSQLRVHAADIFTNTSSQLDVELNATDMLGIPYVVLIEEETLRTGLLKLRCRDTTLFETIHITDIPEYLLNIFMN